MSSINRSVNNEGAKMMIQVRIDSRKVQEDPHMILGGDKRTRDNEEGKNERGLQRNGLQNVEVMGLTFSESLEL